MTGTAFPSPARCTIETTGDTTVFWILGPIFAAVGIYLIWYGRRRGRMLATFARSHGLAFRRKRAPELEEAVNAAVDLDSPFARAFSRVRDPAEGDGVTVFRAIEALDLARWGSPENSHHHRIAATFAVPERYDEFFLIDRDLATRTPLPDAPPVDSAIERALAETLSTIRPRHTLSVTLSRGLAVLHFEPRLVGSENLDDVNALYDIARRLREALARPRAARTDSNA